MNYYIQGDAAKAANIKAAFEKLGYDVKGWAFTSGIYYTLNGKIVNTNFASNEYKLVLNNPGYKKLELPVETKFKVGDFVVYCGKTYQITDIGKCTYTYTSLATDSFFFNDIEVTDNSNSTRLWTIADANDGDVLVSGIGNPFIYDGNIEFSFAGAYIGVSRDGRIRFDMFPSKAWTSIKDAKPATKEQRDLLFSKMREADYEWDADKKELRKIIKPMFKVGDWLYHNTCGVRPILVEGYNELQGYKVVCIKTHYCLPKRVVENEYHLWTIADAKDGDVITNGILIVIFNKLEEPAYKQRIIAYAGLDLCGRLQITEDAWQLGVDRATPATKEQRDLLFAKMKEAGYEWDADKKELKKIQPHYDISNFKPFDKVLVRNGNDYSWNCGLFSYLGNKYFACCGSMYRQCIPYEGNEALLGTTDMCDECYINW